MAKYIPDFLIVTDTGLNVIAEVKGQMTDEADMKAKAALRWVDAVNAVGDYGRGDTCWSRTLRRLS